MEFEGDFSEDLLTSDLVPITRLNPLLPKQPSSSIQAIVTLIWPYSSSNRTLTILLAERDFRLRRSRGQVRVQFVGSSAQHVSESGIGSGDEVILSLAGVEWAKDESTGQTPGRGIEWELRYSERLLLQIKQTESSKIWQVNIDNPKPVDLPLSLEQPPSPLPIASPPRTAPFLSQIPGLSRTDTNEWSSPAFIKRARDSYGALFDSGSDIFDDDGTDRVFSRKRTKFGRESGSWRYSSRSPSPEAEKVEETLTNDFSPQADVKPLMTDEGCQTLGLDYDAAGTLASLSPLNSASGGERYVRPDIMSNDEIEANFSPPGAVANEMPGVTVDMPPPPKPTSTTNSAYQLNDGNTVGEHLRTFADPPRLLPVSEEALPLVSPLESSGSGLLHGYFNKRPLKMTSGSEWYQPSTIAKEEVRTDFERPVPEDLYGLSPETGSLEIAEVAYEMPLSEGVHENKPHIDLADQYGHWQQTAIETTEQFYPSNSLSLQSPSSAHNDSELESRGPNHETGPYYDQDMSRSKTDEYTSVYPDPDDEFTKEPSRTITNEVRYPELLDTSYQNIQRQSSHGNSPARINAATVAMSRSHSALSETIDLTEDSDEDGEGEEFNEDIEIGHGEDTTSSQLRRKDSRHVVGISEGEDAEYGEEEFDEEEYYDEEEPDIETPRFQRRHRFDEFRHDDEEGEEGGERQGDEDGDEEEMEDYDEDEFSDEEAASIPPKSVVRGPPDVINLLSSDEEDNEIADLLEERRYAPAPHFSEKDSSEADASEMEDEWESDIDGIGGYDLARNPHLQRLDVNGLEQQQSAETQIEQISKLNRLSTKEEGHQLGLRYSSVNQPIASGDIESEDAGDEHEMSIESSGHANFATKIITTPSSTLNEVNSTLASGNGEVRYPALPEENRSDKYPPLSEDLWNGQLPTPEATQLTSAAILSANVSFSSTIEHQPISGTTLDPVPERSATEKSPKLLAADAAQSATETTVSGMLPPSESDIAQPSTTPISSRLRSSTVEVEVETAERSSSDFADSSRMAEVYDASAELLMAELDAAERKTRETLLQVKSALLNRGLITEFADFTPLKILRFNMDKKLDNISVATTKSTEPKRAPKGLRHYVTFFNVVDPSTPSGVIEIQIFRPYKEALPIVDVGDSILLRNFAVRSEKSGFALRSEDASSWLVFKRDGASQNKGPPVEYGAKEKEFAERLQLWFDRLDADGRAKINKANADRAGAALR